MNGYWYRYSLVEWCKETERKLVSLRGQKENNMNEGTLQKWENTLAGLKNDVDHGNNQDEIYTRARGLHEDIESVKNGSNIEFARQQGQIVQPVPIGGHRLPPLTYPYHALEPVIAEEIMKLHHLKHHKGYVDGLNKAEKELQKARESGDFSLIKHWEREAAFHGAGHYLHTIFWTIMKPDGGGAPKGPLGKSIDETFGSFDKFKMHFTEAAKNVEAVGWAILVWSPRAHRLEILQAEKHQNLTQWDVIPLLVLDVWEHAYYLQYKNERPKYIENWWKVVNWHEVEQRFNKAKTVMWQPF